MSDINSSIPVAGDEAILARRYTAALYALAEQDNALDAVADELRVLSQLWRESAEWRQIAADPRLSEDNRKDAVEAVAGRFALSKITGHFLSLLAVNHRLMVLPAVIAEYHSENAARHGEHRAIIRSARALTHAQRDQLEATLSAALGGKAQLDVIEDPTLLGGLTVKLGSQLIDASVKNKLDLLERYLKADAA